MLDARFSNRMGRPAFGALIGLVVACLYWLLDGWLTPHGSGLADCAAWFGGLGFASGVMAIFESETDMELD
jgi:uncharacterized membrane protein